MNSRWVRWWPAAAAVLVLAGGSSVAVAAASGAFSSRALAPNGECSAPSLPGVVIDVKLADMGGMMWGGYGARGTTRISLSSDTAAAGTVSFRVANTGRLVHELVVLPLAPSHTVGERPIGADNRVSEKGSLGEASNTCGQGAGAGIDAGAISWVTLHLNAGNYELVCNIPGHYAGGMFAKLRVG
ncbi:MAG: sulfocyanin-like copper-binding protein [Actinomycetota bacterium]|jgi:uncharacterized cupredoxin-like copper-binding protein|nr:sulfocyanin-like copper-binding protein [Actinomycetota bacterium]